MPAVRPEARASRRRLLALRRFRARVDRGLGFGATGAPPVLAVVEVDRLDVITDGLGRAAGEAVLREVARRITGALPPGTLATRLGGSRFAVAVQVADRYSPLDEFEALGHALSRPYELDACEVCTSASVGVARFPADGRSTGELLDSAERAVTRVREAGGNGVLLHEPAMRSSALDRLELEAALRGALEREELWVAYQPRVDIRTGAITGAEALLRWEHPELGAIAPAQFVPIAEATGLIGAIGEWVLETACRQLRAWDRLGLPRVTVAVNVSPRQFELGSVSRMVRGVLARTGVAPARLELELTESVDLQDPVAVATTLAELRRLGVHCALDDFGTGYSCLSHLTHMPLAALKIDRAFTRAIRDDPDGSPHSQVVVSVIELARRLDLQVVAEGVETPLQLDFLRRHGCAQAQGYLFSRPVSAPVFAGLLRARQATRATVIDLRDRTVVPR